MNLGKSLRLRRVFVRGRALVADTAPLEPDPLNRVRHLARAGVDAIVVTPGMLDAIAEELDELAVILRVEGGPRGQQLVSVQAALELGAEAVLVSLLVRNPWPSESVERFGRVTEDARRLGMPVLAEIHGEASEEGIRLAAEYGADVLRIEAPPAGKTLNLVRAIGRPLLLGLDGEPSGPPRQFLNTVYDYLQGPIHGLVLGHPALTEPAMLEALHGLVHQGVSAAEAVAVVSR